MKFFSALSVLPVLKLVFIISVCVFKLFYADSYTAVSVLNIIVFYNLNLQMLL